MMGLVRAQLEKVSTSLSRQVIMLLDLGAQHVMNRLDELTPSSLAGVARISVRVRAKVRVRVRVITPSSLAGVP